MFDSDKLISFKLDVSMPTSQEYDRHKSGEGYHAVPPPYTGTFMPPKPDLVFYDAPTVNETVPTILHVEPINTKPNKGNISYLSDFEEINRGYVAFGGNPKGCKITSKGKIKTWKLDFDDVYFVKELKFNLFSVSQMCDKKNSVLFTNTECVVLFFDFKFPDDNHVLLRVPRENNMYNVDLKNIVPLGDLTCLFEKTTLDESNLWHKRLGHINFKTMNKLVKGNLVRGLPSQVFENNHTCVACKKGKQHKASWSGPTWLFDIDTLAQSMNYQPVVTGNQPNSNADDEEDVGAEVDFFNFETNITVSLIPTFKVHKDHPVTQIIGDLSLAPQTRSMKRMVKEQGGLTQINNDDFHTYMFACILSQEEPKRVHKALKDPSWIEAMNKKDKRGIVIRNKAQLVAQGHTQEEGINYEEVFALVARIEAIRLFLAYASFMGFMVYQMDGKSAFICGTIKEEVYVCQPPGFEDPIILIRGKIDQTLFIKKQKGDILLVQVYVDDIIFRSTNKDLCKDGKLASTLIDTEKPLLKDPDGEDVDVHTYRYLEGKLHLGLWYPKDSPFNLVAYFDSDYDGASLDRKSTTEQCNLLSSGISFLRQGELSLLAVGTSSGSGNSITCNGNALCILFPTILP
nr:putative ribonuclease H-like domain-containing protein [Tanacetum cinerariifolium]